MRVVGAAERVVVVVQMGTGMGAAVGVKVVAVAAVAVGAAAAGGGGGGMLFCLCWQYLLGCDREALHSCTVPDSIPSAQAEGLLPASKNLWQGTLYTCNLFWKVGS
jgi:hypothetical protein